MGFDLSDYECRRTYDYEIVVGVMGSLFDETAEDGAKLEPPNLLDEAWVLISYKGEIVGTYRIKSLSSVCAEIHVLILKEMRAHAMNSAKLVLDWAFDTMPELNKLVTTIPEVYESVISFAEKNGFLNHGYNSGSYKKDGHICGTYMYGLSRENYMGGS